MKEEISVYFLIVLGRGVAGKERPRMDGKRITPARSAVAAREGLRILPSKREGLLQTEDHMARGHWEY
jgi:hypothetical protein